MSTSKPYHHGDLRRALLDAALLLLKEQGPIELSLRGVARRAGVSAMAPYRHFADKDALLAAVAGDGFGKFADRLRQATAAEKLPRDGLIAQGIAYVRFACDEPALFRLMFGPLIAEGKARESLHKAGTPALTALQAAVAATAPNAENRADQELACWSIVHGLACLIVDGQIRGPGGAILSGAEAEKMARPVIGLVVTA